MTGGYTSSANLWVMLKLEQQTQQTLEFQSKRIMTNLRLADRILQGETERTGFVDYSDKGMNQMADHSFSTES